MSKKFTFLGVLLLAVVVSSYSVSGTYAKYTSKIDLADEARVAKWEIGLSDPTEMKELSLFKSSYTFDEDGIVVTALKADGSEDTKTNVVAPGTHGQYTFALTGTLETAFTLDVKATVVDNVKLAAGTYKDSNGEDVEVAEVYAPIQYSLDNTTWMNAQGLEDALNALYSTNNSKNVYAPQTVNAKGETTIYWRWAFDENDTANIATGFTSNSIYDTLLGNDGELTVEISMTITAEQSKLDVTHTTLD